MRVELDKKALFALASDTRVEILQALQAMRRTVTQLAEELGIDKAAVHRHLKKLVEGGLVKRYDDHGFVYYGLCWKTRDILNPSDNTKIVILLTSSIVLLMVAVAAVAAGLSYGVGPLDWQDLPIIPSTGDRFQEGEATGLSDDTTPQPGGLPVPLWVLVAAALLIAVIPLLFNAGRLLRRPKQKRATLTSTGAE